MRRNSHPIHLWKPNPFAPLPGEENLVIGTDYGHGDNSSELNAIPRFKAMEGLSAQVKRKILSDNPRRFYGFEVSPLAVQGKIVKISMPDLTV